MNLSTVGAGARTVGAFVSEINEETGPAWPLLPFASVPTSLGGRDSRERAPVNLLGHRHVSRTHSSVATVSQYTAPAHDAPRWASGARHPEPVSVLIHTV
jgi:hypothetical protein